MTSRRDFLKKAGILTAAGLAASTPSLAQKNSDALDDLLLEINNDPSTWTHRTLRDHYVDWSYAGLPISISLNDAGNNTNDDDWSVELYSDNMADLSPQTSGNVMGANAVPEELAEQPYTMTYLAPDTPAGHSGVFRTVDEEIDRYMTKFTITYEANGNTETLPFFAPNSVTKKIFGWDPNQPIPWEEFFSYDRANQPVEFENAFNNLYEILTDPAYAVQNSRITNRNTPSPCPDPNPWYGSAAVLEALAEDPMTIDDLYPTLIAVEMTDFTNYNKLSPENKQKANAKYLKGAIPVVAGMASARKLAKSVDDFKMPSGKIYESEGEFQAEQAAKDYKPLQH